MKKTKIVATMSDFRCTEEFVKNLYDAGMDVVRVNSAHVTEDGATHIVETVHRVNPAIPIMIDTKGPEIRVTTIADEYGNSINFRPGDRVAVRGSDGSDKTTRKVVYMNVPNIVDDIPVGARMLIADGELEIRVVEKTAEGKALQRALLQYYEPRNAEKVIKALKMTHREDLIPLLVPAAGRRAVQRSARQAEAADVTIHNDGTYTVRPNQKGHNGKPAHGQSRAVAPTGRAPSPGARFAPHSAPARKPKNDQQKENTTWKTGKKKK